MLIKAAAGPAGSLPASLCHTWILQQSFASTPAAPVHLLILAAASSTDWEHVWIGCLDGLQHILAVMEGPLGLLLLCSKLVSRLCCQDKSVGPESRLAERSVNSSHLIRVHPTLAGSAPWLWK